MHHRSHRSTSSPVQPALATSHRFQIAALALASSLALAIPLDAHAQAGTAAAQQASVAFSIDAQSLGTALGEFSRQSGQQVLFNEGLVRGKTATAVSGNLTPRQALERLLAGSGIQAHPTADGQAITLRPSGAGAPAETTGSAGASAKAEATLLEVRVLGTAEQELRQALGVSIITADDLARRPPANDLSEILATQPGVSLSGASSTGAYGNQREIDLRGMGVENTMILVDGKPVQSRQGAITRRTGDRDTGGDTNWVPADQIERVEIIRGPAAARYGSGAAGGVVNIITKKPADKLTGSVTTYLSKPEDSEEGSGTRRLGFNLSGPISEKLSFRVYGSAARTGGDKPTINGVDDNGDPLWVAGREGRRNRDINGLLRWDLTPDQVIEFQAGFSRQGNMYAGDTSNISPATVVGSGVPVMVDWANRGAETRRVYRQNASVTHRGKWGDVGDSRVVFQYENSRTLNCRQGSGGRTEGNCSDPVAQQRSDLDNYFFNGELNTPFQLLGLNQVLTTGIEYRRQKLSDDNNLLGATSGNPVEMKNNNTALYLEDNIGVGNSLILTPGLRLDHHSQFGNNWSPSLNAQYELGSGFTLKGGIARVFKAPTPYQTSPSYESALGGACPYNNNLDGLVSGVDYDCTVRGNADLKPEISVNKEIGVAWDQGNGWNASLAYFRNDYKNRIVAEAPSLVTDINNPIMFQWMNSGKALIHGLEGNFNIPLLGASGNRLKLINNFTWMFENKRKDTNQPLSVLPKYTLNSTLDWRVTDKFSTQLTSTLYGRRKPRNLSFQGYPMVGEAVRERGSYVLLGLSGTYEFSKSYRLGFGVNNLLDRQIKRAERLAYANSRTEGDLANGIVSTGAGALTYNEPGRAYYVTFTASF